MPKTEYRVVLHYRDGSTIYYYYPETPEQDHSQAMVEVLEHEVFANDATGGPLEERISFSGVGPQYVVCLGDEEVTP
ncbi:hypothetical protein [Bythopirellula goksoeyrii]|uniref:Uncharacterized protein n=1 Tax=Bythopirellula goksoeyrii TaxID=1400387 RepID=A0A5B9QAH8_9BACT|nr:hypothetical protein [Bythopirellula goksoeyrii]QEG36084.1 hypothetical protein Pr1d_33930 [Bythopirellula goksoeyrii]